MLVHRYKRDHASNLIASGTMFKVAMMGAVLFVSFALLAATGESFMYVCMMYV